MKIIYKKNICFYLLIFIGQIIPGPGYYNPNFSIKPDGTYFFSNFHNSRCRSFSHAVRSDLNSGMTYCN